MAAKFQFIRSYLSAFGYWIAFLSAIIATVFQDIKVEVISILLCISVVAVSVAFYDLRYRLNDAKKRLMARGKIGEPIGFCGYPRPGTSMIMELERRAGVKASDIRELYLQTCSLSNVYLLRFASYLGDLTDVAEIDLTIIGVEDSQESLNLENQFRNINLYASNELLTEHFNLIGTTKGMFLWYEPEHKEGNHQYIPAKGAVLYTVENREQALKEYWRPLKDEDAVAERVA